MTSNLYVLHITVVASVLSLRVVVWWEDKSTWLFCAVLCTAIAYWHDQVLQVKLHLFV